MLHTEQRQKIPHLCHKSHFSNTGPVHSNQWRYVETLLNPVDKASRGMKVDALLRNDHWSQVNPFLKQPKETWLQRPAISARSLTATQKANDQSKHINEELEKFFSWTCLKKVMAWVLCYKQNLNKQSQRCQAKKIISYQSDVSKIK